VYGKSAPLLQPVTQPLSVANKIFGRIQIGHLDFFAGWLQIEVMQVKPFAIASSLQVFSPPTLHVTECEGCLIPRNCSIPCASTEFSPGTGTSWTTWPTGLHTRPGVHISDLFDNGATPQFRRVAIPPYILDMLQLTIGFEAA
jgi:hypothetical protein